MISLTIKTIKKGNPQSAQARMPIHKMFLFAGYKKKTAMAKRAILFYH